MQLDIGGHMKLDLNYSEMVNSAHHRREQSHAIMSLFQTCFNFSPVREAQYGQYYMRSKSSIAFHGNVCTHGVVLLSNANLVIEL